MVEDTDHRPRESALARLRGSFGGRRSSDALRMRRGRSGPVMRVLRSIFFLLSALLIIGAAGAGFLTYRLAEGPISLEAFKPHIERDLDGRLGQGYAFRFEAATIEKGLRGPGLVFTGVVVRDPGGRTILSAPRAEVVIHFASLLQAEVAPVRLDFLDLSLRLSMAPDGSLTILAGNEPVVLSPPVKTQERAVDSFGEALRMVIDAATSRNAMLGELKHIGVSRGTLVFEDQAADQSVRFDDLDFAFEKSRSSAHLGLSATGPNGRWRVDARTVEQGEDRGLDVEVTDLSFDELSLFGGLRDPPFDFDMPLSFKVRLGLTPQGDLGPSEGSFSFGSGYFFLHDPDHEPALVDALHGAFRFDPASRRFVLDSAEWRTGASRIGFSATLIPPKAPDDPWLIEGVSAPGSVFGPERPGQTPVVLERGRLVARAFPQMRKVVIDQFDVFGPQVDLKGTLEASLLEPGQPRLQLGLIIGRMPSQAVLRLWPSTVAPPVRSYLFDRLGGGVMAGKIAVDFDAAAFTSMKQRTAPPDASVRVDFTVSNGVLQLLPGVPPLVEVEASGVVTGRTTALTITRGALEGHNGRRLALADATFQAPDNGQKPAPASVLAHFTGSLDAVADILGREGMKPYGGMQIDSAVMKGQVDALLNINLKLSKKASRPDDTVVRVNAAISNLIIEKLIGKERLEQGQLTVVSDGGGLKGSGQGRLLGGPVSLDLKQVPGGDMEAVVGFQLDDAGRNRLGMTLGAGVAGPIGVRVTSAFGVKDLPPAQVELDLQRTNIDGVLPGLLKPAGRPAKASFLLDSTPRGSTIDQLVFESAAGASVRGSLELDANGAFRSARLSQFRLSPGDDMKIDVDEVRDALKVTVRAGSMDARPFLKSLLADANAKDISSTKDIDLDLRASTIIGANRQSLTGLDLKVLRQAGGVRNFQLQARAGRAPIIGVTTRSSAGDPVVSISTGDGGAFLNFLDVYKRMEGGKFEFAARFDAGGVDGSFRVSDFILRDEPALRRLVTEGVALRDDKGALKIDTGASVFSRMQAAFTRTGSEITIRDGLLYGNQIGIKLDGAVDFDRDRVNVVGTFVPAYGVNNLFSQIPVFGPILGGGSNEGLFAVNFRATGAASAPQLAINPLSAIAPGLFRKIFGVGETGPGPGAPSPPTDIPPAPPPPLR